MKSTFGVRQGVACLCFCLLVVVGRVAWTGWSEYNEALEFESKELWHDAAVRHGRAIHMYLPGSPLAAKAGDRLVALAQAAEERGEVREARFCYEELRSGFLSIRSFYQPGADYLRAAEDGLTPLMLEDPRGNWPSRDKSVQERTADIRAVFAEREDPHLFWVLMMGLGYFLWLGAAARAIWRGLPIADEASVDWSSLRRWSAVSALGYLVWLLAIWQA